MGEKQPKKSPSFGNPQHLVVQPAKYHEILAFAL
jgi:hypothetical protein